MAQCHEEQGCKLPGLIEGSPVAPLLLGVLLAEELVPYVEPEVDLHLLWVDDGLALARDPNAADRVHRVLDERLKTIGLKLHAKKTRPITFDPMTTRTTNWSFLGFAFRGWMAVPSEQTIVDLLADLEDLLDRHEHQRLRRVHRVREPDAQGVVPQHRGGSLRS